ncbi:MAG: hypothetical protein AAFY37_12940, partial [Pseudomonadota bacterium]
MAESALLTVAAWLWNAFKGDDPAPADFTIDSALKFPSPVFILRLIADNEPGWTDLAYASVLKVDVMEPLIVAFVSNGAAARANGVPAQLSGVGVPAMVIRA